MLRVETYPVATLPEAAEPALPVPLTELAVGERARLHAADLVGHDREMLFALGLATSIRFRLCKAGNPWIVQIRGTRVGLSEAVAHRLLVIREAGPPERTPAGHA
jgi:Fe2+ transport system protein FeoA